MGRMRVCVIVLLVLAFAVLYLTLLWRGVLWLWGLFN